MLRLICINVLTASSQDVIVQSSESLRLPESTLLPQEDINDIVSGLPGGATFGRLLGRDCGGLSVTVLVLGLLFLPLLEWEAWGATIADFLFFLPRPSKQDIKPS